MHQINSSDVPLDGSWDTWADLYDRVDADRTEMVAFYQSLIGPQVSSVLELGSGTGRITSALADRVAETRGGIDPGSLVGIDISEAMLDVARSRDSRCTWILGDMRTPPVSGPFDLIVCCYNSLQHMLSDEDISGVFSSVRDLLAQNGTYAFDLYYPNEAYLATPQSNRLVRTIEDPHKGLLELREDTSYDASSRIYTVDWRLTEHGNTEPVRTFRQFHRQYPATEIDRLLAKNGLCVKRRLDDYSFAPRPGVAKKQVVLAERLH